MAIAVFGAEGGAATPPLTGTGPAGNRGWRRRERGRSQQDRTTEDYRRTDKRVLVVAGVDAQHALQRDGEGTRSLPVCRRFARFGENESPDCQKAEASSVRRLYQS